MPSAIFTATNANALKLPLNQRNIAVLADTAAQRSLVTKDAVARLGLESIGSERACLVGYGNKKPQNSAFNVVTISLSLPNCKTNAIIDAYVVDKQCAEFGTTDEESNHKGNANHISIFVAVQHEEKKIGKKRNITG